jgi:hypothetical protein
MAERPTREPRGMIVSMKRIHLASALVVKVP